MHKNKSPKLLFLGEFCQRFSFWGLQSLLVLYLTHSLLLQDKKAYLVFGAFTACTYSLTIIGGFFADYFLGAKKAVLIGGALTIAGNIFLIFSNLNYMYLGLALIVCGSGLFVPNNANLFGFCYEPEDSNRSKGFNIFYMCTNLGGLLGPIIYGILFLNYGWQSGFLISGILLGIWFILFLYNFKFYNLHKSKTSLNSFSNYRFLAIPILAIIIFTIWLTIYFNVAGILLTLISIVSFFSLFLFLIKSDSLQRRIIFILLLMVLFTLFFFASSLQVNSSLVLFIDQYVNRQFLGANIPTNVFSTLEPLSIIILSPFAVYLWGKLGKYEPSIAVKLILSLLLAGISFYVFSAAATRAALHHSVSIYWLFAGNFILGAGEICLMPTVLSTISKLAPAQYKGTMIGFLYLSLAFSGYFSVLLASFTTQKSQNTISIASQYAHVYSTIAALCLGISIIALLIYYFSRKKFQGATYVNSSF